MILGVNGRLIEQTVSAADKKKEKEIVDLIKKLGSEEKKKEAAAALVKRGSSAVPFLEKQRKYLKTEIPKLANRIIKMQLEQEVMLDKDETYYEKEIAIDAGRRLLDAMNRQYTAIEGVLKEINSKKK